MTARMTKPTLALAAALALLVVGLAEAGIPGLQRVTVANKPGGPYAAPPTVRQVNVAPGAHKNRYVRVRSTAKAKETLTLREHTAVPPDYRVRWYKGVKGSRNITGDVRGAGYQFNLKPDQRKRFRVWFRAKPDSTSPELCYQGEFEGPVGFDYASFKVNSPDGCN